MFWTITDGHSTYQAPCTNDYRTFTDFLDEQLYICFELWNANNKRDNAYRKTYRYLDELVTVIINPFAHIISIEGAN